jgi:apolipoprotein N-acyltransferase
MKKHKRHNTRHHRLRNFTQNHPYWTAFLVGCVYFGVVISWMFGVRTAEIAQGFAVKLVAASAAIIMITSLSLGFVLFVWLKRRLRVSLAQPRAVWLIPMLWVVAEYARAVIFSIVSLGPGGRIGPYWAYGDFGYLLAETPLVYLARFGGLYLLSFVVVAIFVAGYQLYKLRRWQPLIIVMGIAVIGAGLGWLVYRQASGPMLRIGAVRYANKNSAYTTAAESYNVVSLGAGQKVDTLVLPEYSHYFASSEDVPADSAIIQSVSKDAQGLVVHSANENVMTLGHNMLSFHSADGKLLNQQQKWFVVPAGEYVPYIYQIILAYAGQEQLLLNFNQQKSVERGETPERPFEYHGVRYGAHACSGVLSPDFYNQLAQQGSDIFINSAALDTMGLSSLLHYEAEQTNRLAAVAHAKPFVQGAKGGPAYILDRDGKEVAFTFSKTGGVVVADVQTNGTKTIYTYLGEWVVYGAIAVTVYMLIKKYILPRFKNHQPNA